MDFSDDDDCFCRYDQEEAFMGNKEGSFQLEGEMLPLEEDRPNRLQARVFPLFSNNRLRQEGERKGREVGKGDGMSECVSEA